MRYVLIGDIHGADLNPLEEILTEVDALICTGDFDSVDSILQFKEMGKRLFRDHKKKIYCVPGNHDYGHVNKDSILSSVVIDGESVNYIEFSAELHNNSKRSQEALKFLNNLIQTSHKSINLDQTQFPDAYGTIIVHGGFAGDTQSSGLLSTPHPAQELWFRLECEEDYRRNFEIMENSGITIMIHGHDHGEHHYQEYATINNKDEIQIFTPPHRKHYSLLPQKQHIINPGAICRKDFAIIETGTDIGCPVLIYQRF
jgi:predicted phosphodiesterase